MLRSAIPNIFLPASMLRPLSLLLHGRNRRGSQDPMLSLPRTNSPGKSRSFILSFPRTKSPVKWRLHLLFPRTKSSGTSRSLIASFQRATSPGKSRPHLHLIAGEVEILLFPSSGRNHRESQAPLSLQLPIFSRELPLFFVSTQFEIFFNFVYIYI